MTYELEVKNILRSLLRQGESALETLTRRYQDFLETFGVRPTAIELFEEGYNPRTVRPAHRSWLGFVLSQSGLNPVERQAYESTAQFLDSLEVTEMSRSYKMVVLTAMLNRGVLPGRIALQDLVAE